MANVKKNDLVEITIDDIGSSGEGIGKYEGYTLFVKDATVGDRALVKVMKTGKSYGFAKLQSLIEPSPYRVEPRCPIASKCGGCQLQHVDYKKQLEYKENTVRNCLTRIGGFKNFSMEAIVGMEDPYYYRNKSQFPVARNKDGSISIGFYAGRTHTIIDTHHCYIAAEVNIDIIKVMREFIEEYHIEPYDEENHKGLLRHILTREGYKTGEVMVCLIINGKDISHKEELISKLREIPGMKSICLNINKDKSNVILGEKIIPLWGEPYITDYIGDIAYRISPISFYQVNPIQTKKLYDTALEYADLHGDEVVWDLYCGIGTVSLFLAQKAKMIYGVEIVPQAVEDAKINAKINGIDNAQFLLGAAEEVLPTKYREDNIKADLIVVDPPRKGCEQSLLDTILSIGPKKVVYISCDPATLARDLKYLCAKDYEIVKVKPVDQFGHSVHVETVVSLSHKNADSHIHVNIEFGEGDGKIPVDKIAQKAEDYRPGERVTHKIS